MSYVWRGIGFFGALLFAASFFLPFDFYNSPAARFLWALDAVFPFSAPVESLVFILVCCAIVYPYLWALIAAVSMLVRGSSGERLALRGQIGCHLAGGVAMTVVGITLLVLGDTYTPRALQWVLAVVPATFFIVLLVAASVPAPDRRIPLVTALSLVIFIPPQLILAQQVILDGGDSWGFFLGAGGGILGLIGSVGILFRRGAARAR